MKNDLAFSQAWRNLPADVFHFKAWTEVPHSGRGRPRLLRTHRKFYALLIVATSSDRLFLSGLLASRARLRFTGTPILNPFRDRPQ